jgi:DNA-directed RNA polymerase subunit alpha
MAILSFQKPEKVFMIESSPTVGKFEFQPLEPGYAMTIGNALRRVLLSSLEGYAITSVKISGVDHEYASIRGVVEDVVSIILNLKQIRFKRIVDDDTDESDTETVRVSISDKTEFKAQMLDDSMMSFKVLNPNLVICRMEPSVSLQMELTIKKGRGYVPADENRVGITDVQVLAIDSIHTPIRNVNYWKDDQRVAQRTDFEKLTLEIATDGSITPINALKDAAAILIQHFMLFTDQKFENETLVVPVNAEEYDGDNEHMRQLLKMPLADLELSVRALNCLHGAGLITLGDLVGHARADLLKFRNFGRKSLVELDEKLSELNLNFGMNLSQYNLEEA